MPGFRFRYRLSGEPPTIGGFLAKPSMRVSRGDMLNAEDEVVDLALTGDSDLIGAVDRAVGEPPTAPIMAIVDADAVYTVEDHHDRLKGATLDVFGLTGEQGVAVSVNAEFVVDVDSSADEETLVRINPGKHHDKTPHATPPPLTGGELNAAIARAVVRYHSQQVGRGPTMAQAFYRGNIIVVVLQGVMTTAERSLVDAGRSDAVRHTQRAYQDMLRPYLRSTVERLTASKVLAFMSTSNVEPDVAAEIFFMDRPIDAQEQD